MTIEDIEDTYADQLRKFVGAAVTFGAQYEQARETEARGANLDQLAPWDAFNGLVQLYVTSLGRGEALSQAALQLHHAKQVLDDLETHLAFAYQREP